MDFKLSINESKMLSSHISRLCKAVGKEKAQIYARYADLINLAPNLKDNQEESDDEDDFADEEHRGRDEPRDGHRAKDDALKDDFRDSFKDDLKEPAAGDHLKESSSRNGEESKNERRDEKKFTTQDRCFMQTFQAASLAEPAPDRSLSNYERLKLKLRLQQMMAKPAEKLNKNESKNIQLLSKFVMQSSLTPKSLNDFSRYSQGQNGEVNGEANGEAAKRKSNRPTTKLLDLIYSSSILPGDSVTAEPLSTMSKPKPCQCRVEISIPWYPCEVKYCPRPTAGESDPTTAGTLRLSDLNRSNRVRCGIRSCKRSWVFYFQVDSKSSCLWDE